jgi:hypothetical protein
VTSLRTEKNTAPVLLATYVFWHFLAMYLHVTILSVGPPVFYVTLELVTELCALNYIMLFITILQNWEKHKDLQAQYTGDHMLL